MYSIQNIINMIRKNRLEDAADVNPDVSTTVAVEEKELEKLDAPKVGKEFSLENSTLTTVFSDKLDTVVRDLEATKFQKFLEVIRIDGPSARCIGIAKDLAKQGSPEMKAKIDDALLFFYKENIGKIRSTPFAEIKKLRQEFRYPQFVKIKETLVELGETGEDVFADLELIIPTLYEKGFQFLESHIRAGVIESTQFFHQTDYLELMDDLVKAKPEYAKRAEDVIEAGKKEWFETVVNSTDDTYQFKYGLSKKNTDWAVKGIPEREAALEKAWERHWIATLKEDIEREITLHHDPTYVPREKMKQMIENRSRLVLTDDLLNHWNDFAEKMVVTRIMSEFRDDDLETYKSFMQELKTSLKSEDSHLFEMTYVSVKTVKVLLLNQLDTAVFSFLEEHLFNTRYVTKERAVELTWKLCRHFETLGIERKNFIEAFGKAQVLLRDSCLDEVKGNRTVGDYPEKVRFILNLNIKYFDAEIED